ncbi:MAG: hypothetical protein ACKVT2_16655 [Saprospiraceae bacterium]
MWHLRTIQIFLLALILTTCKKSNTEIPFPSHYSGTATVEKNGMLWTAYPFAAVNPRVKNTLNIGLDSLDAFRTLWEKIALLTVPTVPGTYPVLTNDLQERDPIVGASLLYTEADLVYGYYGVLIADSSSFVTLLSYDTISREIIGTFELTMIAFNKPYPSAPDTIRLRNGKFNTKVL